MFAVFRCLGVLLGTLTMLKSTASKLFALRDPADPSLRLVSGVVNRGFPVFPIDSGRR